MPETFDSVYVCVCVCERNIVTAIDFSWVCKNNDLCVLTVQECVGGMLAYS